jgi:inosine-uridine nucleoside N-ribohydrolase
MNKKIPIIIDTDIGEDIDDLLVLCFALNSPEFEIVGVTTVDGDTDARSRISRRMTLAYGQPDIPVVAGYYRSIPHANIPYTSGTAVHQNDVAPTEEGLPPACKMGADELIAKLANERPGEVYVLTIGSMTNVGQALVRYPETAQKLAGVITNGGNFGPDRETRIGWNLRYDPIAASIVARSGVKWVLLPESMQNMPRLCAQDVENIRNRGLETTDLIMTAIEGWRKNKRECGPDSIPHLSDLICFTYLLGGIIETVPGYASLIVSPHGASEFCGLKIELNPKGSHQLGWKASKEAGQRLHDLFMERLLSPPIAKA